LGADYSSRSRRIFSVRQVSAKERDMTNTRQRKAPEPSIAALTAGLLLLFLTASLTMALLASHAGLLLDGTKSITMSATRG
jgi:hypothetical protein